MGRRGQSRRGERGGISIMLLLLLVCFSFLAVGLIVVGRVMLRKQALQHAADAAALQGAWWMLKGDGMPTSAGLPNGQGAMFATVNAVDGATFNGPTYAFPAGLAMALATSSTDMSKEAPSGGLFDASAITSRSQAKLRQQLFTKDQLVYRRAKVALVLDYSGSMKKPISLTDATQAIVSLRDAVNLFLSKAKEVDVAGILYDTNVFVNVVNTSWNTTGPSANDYTAISTEIGRAPQGDTDTGGALEAANARLSEGEDFGRYILLVSDGEPCCVDAGHPDPAGKALTQGRSAWANDTTLFTIEIKRSDSQAAFHDALLAISGDAGKTAANANRHIHVDDAATLAAVFDAISSTYMCHVVIDAPPVQANFMGAYLRTTAGVEEKVPRYCADRRKQDEQSSGDCPEGPETLSCPQDADGSPQCRKDAMGKPDFKGFRYEAQKRRVIFPTKVCEEIKNGKNIVVRWDRPFL